MQLLHFSFKSARIIKEEKVDFWEQIYEFLVICELVSQLDVHQLPFVLLWLIVSIEVSRNKSSVDSIVQKVTRRRLT